MSHSHLIQYRKSLGPHQKLEKLIKRYQKLFVEKTYIFSDPRDRGAEYQEAFVFFFFRDIINLEDNNTVIFYGECYEYNSLYLELVINSLASEKQQRQRFSGLFSKNKNALISF